MIDQLLSRFFFDQWVVFGITSVLFVLAAQLGCRAGLARQDKGGGQGSTAHGAVLGLLGLLLGFSFAMAVGRHETRRELVVEEANAIGTTWLRAEFLPESRRAEAKSLLRRYAETRVEAYETLRRGETLDVLNGEIADLHAKLWSNAVAVAREQPDPVTVSYVNTLNEMIDLHTSRLAALRNHVPGMVWLLLLVVAVCGVVSTTYQVGQSGRRPLFDLYVFPILVCVVITIISDLDRPQKGFIGASQQPLYEQVESMSH